MHCDQRLTSLEDSFPLGREINNRVHYTGYVIEQTSIDIGARDCAGEVLVSAGGGAAGTALLRTAVKARNLLPDNAPHWRCLVGPNLAEATFQELKRHEYAGLVTERNSSDFLFCWHALGSQFPRPATIRCSRRLRRAIDSY